MELKDLRSQIDGIDSKLIPLLEKRLQVVAEIARYKQEHRLAIFDPAREREVIQKHLQSIEDATLAPYIEKSLVGLMEVSKEYQKNSISNIIFLVGMPGSGKTTVGKALAKALGIEFYELDSMVQEKAGKSIQNIIIYDGDLAFREYEYEAIKDLRDNRRSVVVATGGGTVLSEKTVALMRELGIVVFVHRDVTEILGDLDLEIRPLLKENIEYIFRLYEERCPLYEEVSHTKVENASSISDAVSQIIRTLPFECKMDS